MPDAIWSRAELLAAGFTRTSLARAVDGGELTRLRRDVYCDSTLDPGVRAAASIGSRLGCVSELRRLGIWVTDRPAAPHVHLPRDASRRPAATRVRRHWEPLRAVPGLGSVAPLDALLVALRCQSHADAVASVDSALHQGIVSMAELMPHCGDHRRSAILIDVDRRAESGLESLLRIELRRLGLRVEPQVRIDGVGRVDLLVEDVVVVEVDGAAFHSGPRRHGDHQRDARAVRRGYSALRFDARQVISERSEVASSVVAAVRAHRGGHFSGRSATRALNRLEVRGSSGETAGR